MQLCYLLLFNSILAMLLCAYTLYFTVFYAVSRVLYYYGIMCEYCVRSVVLCGLHTHRLLQFLYTEIEKESERDRETERHVFVYKYADRPYKHVYIHFINMYTTHPITRTSMVVLVCTVQFIK